MEGLSHRDASDRLEALLDEGTLLGRRLEYEHAWDLMARAQSFYHQLLNEDPAGAAARNTLADHGIGSAMIERFMLGYAPVEPVDLLSRHLVAAGYDFECLDSVCFPAEDGTRKMVDRYRGQLLIPVVDSRGRSWGFFQNRLFRGGDNSHNFDEGWGQGFLRLSERRLRRLVFPHPSWPRDFHRYERLLLTRTPWEVIALQQAGIDCAVFMPDGPVANDPITRRTLLAMSKIIVCPFDAEGKGPAVAYELFELDGRESCAIRLMSVPVRGGIVGMLRTDGAAALQAAMNEAVPIEQWTG
jgi:DNA primase